LEHKGGDAALSVVLATPDDYQTIRRTVSHLLAQTAAGSLELVIVARSASLRLPPADRARLRGTFAGVQVVEVDEIRSVGRANAAGVRRATAPVVALAEDHCFPEPGWAERLIAAHRGPWAAVGPVVRNANPGSAVSWADFFIGYGPWLHPQQPREAEFLPGHNTSYKREVLLACGPHLERLLEAETVLHWQLRAEGQRLFLEPGAITAHTNFSLWRSWLPVQYLAGRVFAGARVRSMPPWGRLLFAAGSPLIPWLRLWRLWRAAGTREQRARFLGCLHALVIGLLLDGAGQFVGYVAGSGRATDRIARYEFHRFRHIRAQDRQALGLDAEADAGGRDASPTEGIEADP